MVCTTTMSIVTSSFFFSTSETTDDSNKTKWIFTNIVFIQIIVLIVIIHSLPYLFCFFFAGPVDAFDFDFDFDFPTGTTLINLSFLVSILSLS